MNTTTATTSETALPRQSRMPNPASGVAGALDALLQLGQAVGRAGLPARTRELVHIRVSQINGCGVCSVQHPQAAQALGETDERIWAIAGWRDAPYYSAAERAALALAECITRLDGSDPVPDPVWDEAARHYDEQQLSALVLTAATVNLWNRLNVATHQVAGHGW